MKIAAPQAAPLSIDLTPLIDVVFLLLIFFMVSTTFDRYAKMNVQLPEAQTAERIKESAPVEVVVDAEGKVFINGSKVLSTDVTTIREALLRQLLNTDERSVLLSADADARHADVVRVMDAAAQANVSKLSIATVRDPGGG